MRVLRRHNFILLRFAAVVALGGCVSVGAVPEGRLSSLPSMHGHALRIVGVHGTLDAATRQRITMRLNALPGGDVLGRQLAAMQELAGGTLIANNHATLLVDGPRAYAAMFDAMEHAKHHINIEMYIFDEAHSGGRALSDLLAQRARAGIAVNVLYDAVGSSDTSPELFEKLRTSGVRLCAFNPLNPLNSRTFRFTQRDHRKLVVVDGQTAFAGGINFSSNYSSSSRARGVRGKGSAGRGWRDTQVQVRGPASLEMQRLFFNNWGKQQCPPVVQADYLPAAQRAGSTLLRIDAASRDLPSNATYLAALTALSFSRVTADLTMAYFAPDAQLERALQDAARRGVRVRLLLAGVSDFNGILQAGRAHYAALLESGVRIYETHDAVLHSKTLSVDSIWSTIGSANWDWLSLASNDELNVVVIDPDFAGQMGALFEQDLAAAQAIDAASWSRRPLAERISQQFWSLWERML